MRGIRGTLGTESGARRQTVGQTAGMPPEPAEACRQGGAGSSVPLSARLVRTRGARSQPGTPVTLFTRRAGAQVL